MRRLFIALILAALPSAPLLAQQTVTGFVDANGNRIAVSAANPLPVTGGGGGGGGGGGPITASNGAVVNIGSLADSAWTSGNGTLTAIGKAQVNGLSAINATLGSPLQAGGTVTLGGSLPSFASTPTFNLGTIAGTATAANQTGTGAAAQTIQGAVASGGANSAAPIKVGCAYNTTVSNYTTATVGDIQCAQKGEQLTQLSSGGTSVTQLADQTDAVATGSSANSLKTIGRGTVYNGTTWDRQRGDTTGTYVVGKGGAGLNPGQVSVGTGSTLVVAARAGRQKVTVAVGAANTCAFGNTGVTTTTGFPLQPVAGATITLDTSAAIYAACSATTTVSFIELY